MYVSHSNSTAQQQISQFFQQTDYNHNVAQRNWGTETEDRYPMKK